MLSSLLPSSCAWIPCPRISAGTLHVARWPGPQVLHSHSLSGPSAPFAPWSPKLRTQQTIRTSQYEYVLVYSLEWGLSALVFLRKTQGHLSENIFCFPSYYSLAPHPVSSCKTPIIALAMKPYISKTKQVCPSN